MPRRRPVSDAELHRIAMETLLSDLHVSIPGQVQAYDPAKQRADVLPLVRKPLRGEDDDLSYDDLPVIPSCVVLFPRGGGYGIHWPLQKGDSVVLVFSDHSYGEWRKTGKVSSPRDLRRHGIGYPFALPGIGPDAAPLGTLAAGGLRLGKDGAGDQIRIDAGKIDVWIGGKAAVRVGDQVHCGFLVLNTVAPPYVDSYYPGTAAGLANANARVSALSPNGLLIPMGDTIDAATSGGGRAVTGSSKVNVGG